MKPQTTRLRWVSAVDKNLIVKFCDTLGSRIEIKTMVFDGMEWVLWFIPDDLKADVPSGRLKEKQNARARKTI